MSVKLGLLSLLAEHPAHGYGLRAEFEQRTGGSWPLNIGQVYTTLQRLERDRLVEIQESTDDGHVVYRTTEAGAGMASDWFASTVSRQEPQRDELAIKLAIAAASPAVDVRSVIALQRFTTMSALREVTRTKEQALNADDQEVDQQLGRMLAIEAQVFHIEAELRWLDHIETTLIKRSRTIKQSKTMKRTK